MRIFWECVKFSIFITRYRSVDLHVTLWSAKGYVLKKSKRPIMTMVFSQETKKEKGKFQSKTKPKKNLAAKFTGERQKEKKGEILISIF